MADLFHENTTLKTPWESFPKSTSRDISPSFVTSMNLCPARAMMQRLGTSTYDAYVKSTADAYGVAVHKAIEDGLGFLKRTAESDKTFPGASNVKRLLDEATAYSQEALRQHLPLGEAALAEPSRAVKKMVRDYGKRFLRSGGRLSLLTELPVRTMTLPLKEQAAGITDLLLHYDNSDVAEIVDYKYARARGADIGSDLLSVLKDPKEQIQPRVYALSIFDNRPDINTIKFTYDIYQDNGVDAPRRKKVSTIFSRQEDYALLRSQVADAVSRTTSTMREGTTLLTRDKKASSLKALLKMEKGACNPYACASCPMRYQCRFKTFVEEARRTSNGERFLDSELHMLKNVDDQQKIAESSKTYQRSRNWRKEEFTKTRMRELSEEFDLSPDVIRLTAESDANVLSNDIEALKYHRRGLFQDRLKASAAAARSKLMFNILDPEATARWMSPQVRRNIQAYSTTYIENLAKSFDIGKDFATETVLDNVFKDRELAAHLDKLMMTNTEKRLSELGYSLGKYGKNHPTLESDFQFALRQYSKTIDRNVGVAVQDSLNTEFTRHLLNTSNDKLIRMGINTKDLPLKAITGALTDRNLLESSPDMFLAQVAKNNSFGTIVGKARRGAPRFPVGTLMIAGLLSYIAGANNVRTAIQNKYEKLKFYLTHNRDRVDDGSHASIYTVSRRLMYSDFGSRWRKVLGRGETVNRHIKAFRSYFKDMYSVAIGRSANQSRGEFNNILKSTGVGVSEQVKKLIKGADLAIQNPRYIVAGGIAGIATFGILPHIKSDKDIRRSIRERQERFKRLKKVQWSSSSPSIEPESQLRMGYKAHSPMGSPIEKAHAIFKGLRSLPAEEVLKEWKGLINTARNVFLRSDLWQTVTGLAEDIAKKTSEVMGTAPMAKAIKHVESAAREIQSKSAELYNASKGKLATTLRSEKAKVGKYAQESQLAESDLKSTMDTAREKLSSITQSTVGKKAGDLLDATSIVPVIPKTRERPSQVRTKMEMGFNTRKDPRVSRSFDRRAKVNDVYYEEIKNNTTRLSDRYPGIVFDEMVSPTLSPEEFTVSTRSAADRLTEAGGMFLVGSRTKAVSPSSLLPTPTIMPVPASTRTQRPSGHDEKLELISREFMFNQQRRGGHFYTTGSSTLNRLYNACN